MKKIVKKEILENINLDGIDATSNYYDGVSYNKDIRKSYIENKKWQKEQIIKSLTECDDFSVYHSSDDYWGDECTLTTYYIDVESDEDFEKRKLKISKQNKKSAETRKKNLEEKEEKEYLRLKEKFEEK